VFARYVAFIRHAANENWTTTQLEAFLSDSEFPKAHVEVFGAFWKSEREKVSAVLPFVIAGGAEIFSRPGGARLISTRKQMDIFLRSGQMARGLVCSKQGSRARVESANCVSRDRL
jgi:hypothetical protein